MVQSLKRHAAGHGAVPDDGYHVVIFPFQVPGGRDAVRRGDRRGRMAHTEGVVFAFLPFGKAGQAFVGAQGGKRFFASCDDFVDVSLMPYIKDEFVPGRVKDPVQGQGQFHHAQIGSQVPAVLGHDFDEQLPDLLRQPVHFFQ